MSSTYRERSSAQQQAAGACMASDGEIWHDHSPDAGVGERGFLRIVGCGADLMSGSIFVVCGGPEGGAAPTRNVSEGWNAGQPLRCFDGTRLAHVGGRIAAACRPARGEAAHPAWLYDVQVAGLAASLQPVTIEREEHTVRILLHSHPCMPWNPTCIAAAGGFEPEWNGGAAVSWVSPQVTPRWQNRHSRERLDSYGRRHATPVSSAAGGTPLDNTDTGRNTGTWPVPTDSHEEEMTTSEIEALAAPVLAYLRERAFPAATRVKAGLDELREEDARRNARAAARTDSKEHDER